MYNLRILVLTIFLTLCFVQAGETAPSKLKAIPVSDTQVDLNWISSPNEQYDIWQTVDGISWNRIAGPLGAGTNSFAVTSGIQPYKNYYFVLTVSNVDTYPKNYIEGQNASNEAVAYPPNKHAHLYFPASPDSCKNCHTAHTALGPKLLATATISDACISCHDGTQSKYKVTDGKTQNASGVFNVTTSSGPFGSILGATATSNTIANHSVGTAVYHAPGGNPTGTSQEWTEPLGCGSCHDAHDSTSFRMITKKAPDNTNISVQAYAYSDLTPGQEKEIVTYINGISGLCMGCHKDYYALTGSGSTAATGTYQNDGKYRHAIGVDPSSYSKGALTTDLPLEGKVDVGNPKVVTCITCHHAHGSSSATNDSKDYGDGSGPKATNWLLRLDYRGTCENCHKK